MKQVKFEERVNSFTRPHALLAGRTGQGINNLIEEMCPVIAAEKKRRKVKFLPAQVLRKLGIHMGKCAL